MGRNYTFPAVVTENEAYDQALKVYSEAREVVDTATKEGDERVAEEAWDVIQAAETALRIIERNGVDVDAIHQQVIVKNARRRYYDGGTGMEANEERQAHFATVNACYVNGRLGYAHRCDKMPENTVVRNVVCEGVRLGEWWIIELDDEGHDESAVEGAMFCPFCGKPLQTALYL